MLQAFNFEKVTRTFAAMNHNDTIVALATPAGAGAIGIIRLSGDKAISIASEMFFSISGKNFQQQKTHTVHLGHIKSEENTLDEVLATIFRNPYSYTGEDVVEFSCHGSDFIKQEIIKLAFKKGCRLANPGEFTQRAFLNGKMDLSQAEAVADLIASENKAEHQIAIQQMKGGFSDDLKVLREKLINFTALIELELDFSEEDVEFANREEFISLVNEIESYIKELVASFTLGNAIKNGLNTTIVGRPNAGKSTLLNALLNEERAIVSSIAGTTRDTIEEILNIDGIAFRFIDTAGLRTTTDEIEKIGVERALENVNKSSAFIYLFDIANLDVDEVKKDLSQLPQDIPRVVVANKSDLVSESVKESFLIEDFEIVFISAKKKESLELLKSQLLFLVDTRALNSNKTIITNTRHLQALEDALHHIREVQKGFDMSLSGDLLSLDLRATLEAIGRITGEVNIDSDILGTIFGKFCIGK